MYQANIAHSLSEQAKTYGVQDINQDLNAINLMIEQIGRDVEKIKRDVSNWQHHLTPSFREILLGARALKEQNATRDGI